MINNTTSHGGKGNNKNNAGGIVALMDDVNVEIRSKLPNLFLIFSRGNHFQIKLFCRTWFQCETLHGYLNWTL